MSKEIWEVVIKNISIFLEWEDKSVSDRWNSKNRHFKMMWRCLFILIENVFISSNSRKMTNGVMIICYFGLQNPLHLLSTHLLVQTYQPPLVKSCDFYYLLWKLDRTRCNDLNSGNMKESHKKHKQIILIIYPSSQQNRKLIVFVCVCPCMAFRKMYYIFGFIFYINF